MRGASLIGTQLAPAEASRIALEPRAGSVDFSDIGVLGRALARVVSAGASGGVASGSEMTTSLIGAAVFAVGGAVAAGGVSRRWAMVTGFAPTSGMTVTAFAGWAAGSRSVGGGPEAVGSTRGVGAEMTRESR